MLAPFGLRPKGTTISRVLPIARVLAAQGLEVRVVVPPWDDPASAGQRIREGNLEIVQAPLAGSLMRPLALSRELGQLVREFEPDVVHVFKPIGYTGLLGWWWALTWRDAAAPLLVLDCDDLEGSAGWGGRQGLRSLGLFRGLQETLTVRSIGRVTAASRWLESYVRRLGLQHERTLYLANGWERSSEKIPPMAGPRPLKLLWYTRFTEAEPGRVAALLASVLRTAADLRLLVLGDEVEAGARERARSAFAQVGVGERVDWLEYAPGRLRELAETRDLVAIYPLDDNLVNRARSPAKITELMSVGVPVVAEAVGEANTYLADLASTCLATPDDVVGFQRLLGALLGDRELRRVTSLRTRAATDRFEWSLLAGGLAGWGPHQPTPLRAPHP